MSHGGGGIRKVPKKCHVLFEWALNTKKESVVGFAPGIASIPDLREGRASLDGQIVSQLEVVVVVVVVKAERNVFVVARRTAR